MELEITKNGHSASIDAMVKKGEKCFLSANTTDYNCDGNCGVTIGDIVEMKKLGWCGKEDIDKMNSMEIGERYDSEDYYSKAFIIRLG